MAGANDGFRPARVFSFDALAHLLPVDCEMYVERFHLISPANHFLSAMFPPCKEQYGLPSISTVAFRWH